MSLRLRNSLSLAIGFLPSAAYLQWLLQHVVGDLHNVWKYVCIEDCMAMILLGDLWRTLWAFLWFPKFVVKMDPKFVDRFFYRGERNWCAGLAHLNSMHYFFVFV